MPPANRFFDSKECHKQAVHGDLAANRSGHDRQPPARGASLHRNLQLSRDSSASLLFPALKWWQFQIFGENPCQSDSDRQEFLRRFVKVAVRHVIYPDERTDDDRTGRTDTDEWTDRTNGGRTDGHTGTIGTNGRTRKIGRTNGRTRQIGRTNGRTRTIGRPNGRTDGRTNERTRNGRTGRTDSRYRCRASRA